MGQRAHIKKLEVMVAETIIETDDTTTLVLFTGNDVLDYQPGHFVTIDPHQFPALERWTAYLEHVKGRREPPRAYSLSSSPDERYLAITVKEERYLAGVTEYPPLLSPILGNRTARGARMEITGFTGPYVLGDAVHASSDQVVHICAGSGIVPSFSIIKHDLRVNDTLRHTLVYSNKSRADAIFWRQLDELVQEYPERLRVIHTLTREKDSSLSCETIRLGRISRELLAEVLTDLERTAVFTCGPDHSVWFKKAARERGHELPPSFMSSVLAHLEALGVPKDRIKKESYG